MLHAWYSSAVSPTHTCVHSYTCTNTHTTHVHTHHTCTHTYTNTHTHSPFLSSASLLTHKQVSPRSTLQLKRPVSMFSNSSLPRMPTRMPSTPPVVALPYTMLWNRKMCDWSTFLSRKAVIPMQQLTQVQPIWNCRVVPCTPQPCVFMRST